MSRLLTLYPRTWRERYEDEFRGLITERPPTPVDRIDIVRGALDAHIHPQLPSAPRIPDRRGVWPLVGFAMIVVALIIGANGPLHHDAYGAYRDGALALPFLVGAAVLLSIGLYRVIQRLPDAAGGPRLAGSIAIVAGPAWACMPWITPIGLVFLLGVLGLAVGARRTGVLPTTTVAILVALLVVPAALLAAVPFLPWFAFRLLEFNLLVILGPITLVWLVVGAALLHGSVRPARIA